MTTTKIRHEEAIKRRGADEPEVQSRLRESVNTILGEGLEAQPALAWEFGACFLLRPTVLAKDEGVRSIFKVLRDHERFLFNMLIDVTAVDWMDRREPRFDVVYQLLSLTHNHRLCIKAQLPEDRPEIESVRALWPAANFLEREVWDMYGVSFKGHGDQRRILLYDEFVGHPLRKDYPIRGKQPRLELRIPELRNTSDDMNRGELVSLPTRGRGRV